MFDAFSISENIRAELNDRLGLAGLWVARGSSYATMEEFQNAQEECAKALPIAEEYESLNLVKDACGCLYLAHKGLKQDELALTYFERQAQLKDSLSRDETLIQLQIMEFRNQVKKDSIKREAEKQLTNVAHQEQLDQGYLQRNIFVVIGFGLVILSFLFYRMFRKTHASREVIRQEKKKADDLLLNILPTKIAGELLESGKVVAQEFDNVSILFTDIVGFTQASEKLQPQQLIIALNDIYSQFDEIVSRHGIEKIKSIGDAYMAAGGLPVSSGETIKNTVLAGLEIRDYMQKRIEERINAGLSAFEIRIGIHTGPVVAGIIGVRKFQYDIWGDTVNTANRMEQNSEPGRVNISQSTYEAIHLFTDFTFEQRIRISVKGKGDMQMYFVERNQA